MRKGEDTFAMKRRRMPYVAKIRRDDPFRVADRQEIDAMVRRMAASAETFVIAGSRADAGFRLYHFTTWSKARAIIIAPCPAVDRRLANAGRLRHRPCSQPFIAAGAPVP